MPELRDVISGLSVLLALVGMLVVSRNARKATSVQMENADLTRIRDLRSELRETKTELDAFRDQVLRLGRQLTEANDAAMEAYRWRAEALRYAQMPGMDMATWLARFGPDAIAVTRD